MAKPTNFKKWARTPKEHAAFDMGLVASGVHIFCDGACEPNPGAGGWGLVVYRDGMEVTTRQGGHPETTNNIMELTGMLEAIKHANGFPGQAATIWCDSMYVVNGCNDWRHKWKAKGWRRGGPNGKPESNVIANLEIWIDIDAALTQAPAVTISWCKGHNGTVGNDRADELSLLGRQDAIDAYVERGVRELGFGGAVQ